MDKAIEKAELIITILEYAHKHKLDITNKVDVKKILKVFDPTHTSDKEIEEYINLLQTTNTFMEVKANRINSQKHTLPN